MAITTLDQVGAGVQYPREFFKPLTGTIVANRPHSLFYFAGVPGAAVAPTPGTAGAALTSYAGQLPFTNPSSGNTYLARFVGQTSAAGQLLLCDRLWHNSGLSVTSTSPQTVNSVAWPARDANGSTNGEGVYVAVEVTSQTGAGTPVLSIDYTNTAGGTGNTGSSILSSNSTSILGAFYPLGLGLGTTGVKSVEQYTQSATWTSGAISLVAYRILARLDIASAGQSAAIDYITGGAVRMYDNTVPFLVFIPTANTTTAFHGHVIWTQG